MSGLSVGFYCLIFFLSPSAALAPTAQRFTIGAVIDEAARLSASSAQNGKYHFYRARGTSQTIIKQYNYLHIIMLHFKHIYMYTHTRVLIINGNSRD